MLTTELVADRGRLANASRAGRRVARLWIGRNNEHLKVRCDGRQMELLAGMRQCGQPSRECGARRLGDRMTANA